tara:strand:- start:1285 stop:1821 length:537 start_codon:yes stop_codon:yes gene_type:complete
MKTVVLDNLFSKKELFYMYKEIIKTPNWRIDGQSTDQDGHISGPVFVVKNLNDKPQNYPLFVWGQTLVFRINKLLEEKNIGIPTKLNRMWFNSTSHGKKTQHWLHADDEDNLKLKSILLFMTPIWQPDWRGSFYIDGEEFKFKPGSAVIFDSKEYHKGESPESETYNWQRITCNILVG